MIRINLLAVERHRGRKAVPTLDLGQKLTVVCSLVLVATGLLVGWWYWSLSEQSARLDGDIASARQERARLQTIIRQVQAFEQRKALLQQRVTLIEQLRRTQSVPVQLLDQVSRSLPDMLWLTSMDQSGAEVTIQGRCTSLIALSDFVANLSTNGYFQKPVEIVDSQVDQAGAPAAQGGVDLIKFTVKATFAPPAPAPAPAPAAAVQQVARR